jgi:enoyl-CoA hydratase/carnithine racemase
MEVQHMSNVITTETRGHVRLIGLSRAAKRNAFDVAMLHDLAQAVTAADEDPEVRVMVLFAHGDHFTAGLDLAQVGPRVVQGESIWPPGAIEPWELAGRRRTKPLVIAVQGRCLTLGIELLLAADIAVAADDTRFAQIEIKRGIFPFGGATIRFAQRAGWGNAMRWLLTADEFSAAEAYRIGLVQEVAPRGEELARAVAIAETIARQAPLGVAATLRNARVAVEEGHAAAVAQMVPEIQALMKSDDAREGLMSFIERREGRFTGK